MYGKKISKHLISDLLVFILSELLGSCKLYHAVVLVGRGLKKRMVVDTGVGLWYQRKLEMMSLKETARNVEFISFIHSHGIK